MTADPTLQDDLALAHRMIDLASEAALELFHRGVETIVKDDDSPVSEADLEVDRRLLEVLAQERPDDAVLSEESGERGTSNRRWIIDPIDGTFNFVESRPAWGTHVALEVDGEVVLGVISRPMYGQRYWATRGNGAFRSDADTATPTRLQVSATDDLEQSRVCIWTHHTDAELETWGRGCVIVQPATLDNVLQVISGELDAVLASGRVWDHAPAVILIAEAGGTFRDLDGGRRLDLGPSRYTNGRIDDALHRLLSG